LALREARFLSWEDDTSKALVVIGTTLTPFSHSLLSFHNVNFSLCSYLFLPFYDVSYVCTPTGDEVPHVPSYTTENINWWEELDCLVNMGVKISYSSVSRFLTPPTFPQPFVLPLSPSFSSFSSLFFSFDFAKVYGVRALNSTHAIPFYQELSEKSGTVSITFKSFHVCILRTSPLPSSLRLYFLPLPLHFCGSEEIIKRRRERIEN
jgi:hypothetical protein